MQIKRMTRSTFILILTVICIVAQGNSLRRISTAEGLSNNSIFSLHQDHLGHMWIGTTDGLNIWDGHSLEMFNPDDGKNFFAGNTIRDIHPDGNGGIWLRTYYGIAHINTTTREVKYYDSPSFAPYMTCDTDGRPYVIGADKHLYILDIQSDTFTRSETEIPSSQEHLKQLHSFGKDSLFCFTSKGIYLIRTNQNDGTNADALALERKIDTDIAFVSANPEGDICYFVSNNTKDIFAFNMKTLDISLYAEVGSSVPGNEVFRALLPYKGSVLAGFSVSGVYIASPPNSRTLSPTPVKQGIFPLIKDNRQDIIWVGTDGNGVINWQMSDLSFEEIRYDQLPVTVHMPIRSIMLDRTGDLWCGTKGDGIFTIRNFTPYMHLNDRNVRKITTSNSALTSNHVYSISEDRKGVGLWIGSDGPGINYYSYSDRKIKTVTGSEPLTKVHVIHQQDDSTLWISTHGRGAFKCKLEGSGSENPRVVGIERIKIPKPFTKHANIFSMYAPDDSTIYFGSRGAGVACLNTRSNKSRILEIPTDHGYASNDIYGMAHTDRMHFASGCGLISYDEKGDSLEIVDEIPNRAIHAILSDSSNLWISTNYGIIRHDTQSRRTTIHNQRSGLYTIEYSDGAAYKDPKSGALFFGGINGLTVIRNAQRHKEDSISYIPDINITHHISNNVHTLLQGDLKLPYSASSFGIRFSVVDNTNYSDYEFSYRILGLDKKWKSNGNDAIIHLPTLPPGKYTLEIRYHNKSNSYTSQPACLPITIIPPVYATWWAKTLYILLTLGICAYYIRRFRLKYLNLKEELRISKALYGIEHSMIANMYRIINDNIDNPELSPAFIADKMCVTTRVLYRKLEKAPHLKPQKLIKETRMKAAAEMLKNSKLTIDEIMYKVGYDNRSTFYKNFKEFYDCTPKEYRNQGRDTKSHKNATQPYTSKND